jgi:hypothetical protein
MKLTLSENIIRKSNGEYNGFSVCYIDEFYKIQGSHIEHHCDANSTHIMPFTDGFRQGRTMHCRKGIVYSRFHKNSFSFGQQNDQVGWS